jgi:hypothetical protein
METKRARIAARVKTYPRQNPARRPPKFAKARHVRKNVDKVGRAIRNIGHNRQRNKTRMESGVKVCFESGYPARKHRYNRGHQDFSVAYSRAEGVPSPSVYSL